MGMDLINSPMIPVAKSKGRKAQTVVRVVVTRTHLKSRKTNITACSGVNFPVFKYCLVAETTTIASSTRRPSESNRENIERKLRLMPAISITPKLMKKVNGMAMPATKASFTPTNSTRTKETRKRVRKKS